MPRFGVTQERVFEAAAAIMADGVFPTVMGVRKRLGEGSPNTITPFLRAWREENAQGTPVHGPEIPEKVEGAFRQVWSVATLAAQTALETEREALAAMRREMEKELSEMGGEIERLEASLEEGKQREAQMEETLSEAVAAADALAAQNKDLSIENARLDERAKAAEAGRAEIKEQLERLQGTFEAATKAIQSTAPRRKPKPKAGEGGLSAPEA